MFQFNQDDHQERRTPNGSYAPGEALLNIGYEND